MSQAVTYFKGSEQTQLPQQTHNKTQNKTQNTADGADPNHGTGVNVTNTADGADPNHGTWVNVTNTADGADPNHGTWGDIMTIAPILFLVIGSIGVLAICLAACKCCVVYSLYTSSTNPSTNTPRSSPQKNVQIPENGFPDP